uniref:Uncharacterized protein n=1 Tax=Timema cristinae TaxID=61476 RepID=A0A7R9CAW2_TIMCR|nr:unnamed protein product [Timema cristinae]
MWFTSEPRGKRGAPTIRTDGTDRDSVCSAAHEPEGELLVSMLKEVLFAFALLDLFQLDIIGERTAWLLLGKLHCHSFVFVWSISSQIQDKLRNTAAAREVCVVLASSRARGALLFITIVISVSGAGMVVVVSGVLHRATASDTTSAAAREVCVVLASSRARGALLFITIVISVSGAGMVVVVSGVLHRATASDTTSGCILCREDYLISPLVTTSEATSDYTKEEQSSLFLDHNLQDVYAHLRGGRVENYFWKNTLSTSNQGSIPDIPIIGSIAYCESDALDHADTEADAVEGRFTNLHTMKTTNRKAHSLINQYII